MVCTCSKTTCILCKLARHPCSAYSVSADVDNVTATAEALQVVFRGATARVPPGSSEAAQAPATAGESVSLPGSVVEVLLSESKLSFSGGLSPLSESASTTSPSSGFELESLPLSMGSVSWRLPRRGNGLTRR